MRIPAYAGLSVEKVSLLDEEPTELVPEEVSTRECHGVCYTEHSFSHDLVDAQLLSGIITESGLLKPREVGELRLTLLNQARTATELYNSLAT